MSKSIFYRLFRAGAVPENAREQIFREGLVLKEEGVCGSLTMRNFRAPGRFHGVKKQWFTGSIVLTEQHLLAFGWKLPVIGLAWNDPRISAMVGVLEKPGELCFSYDASEFDKDWSGQIEIRYRTPLAPNILEHFQRRRSVGSKGVP